MDEANPFVADLAASPFGRPPCRVLAGWRRHSLTLNAVRIVCVIAPNFNGRLPIYVFLSAPFRKDTRK